MESKADNRKQSSFRMLTMRSDPINVYTQLFYAKDEVPILKEYKQSLEFTLKVVDAAIDAGGISNMRFDDGPRADAKQ